LFVNPEIMICMYNLFCYFAITWF